VQSLAFSPDQTILASGSKDGKVILWHLASNQKLQTRKDHDRAITCVRFVPGSQQFLVTSSLDAKIIILDLSNFEKRILEGSAAPINTIAISPDGKYLASGSADAEIVLWNIEDGEIICSLVGHHDEIVSLAFSSDSSILASGSKDAKVILWHVLKRQQISTFGESEKPMLEIAFSHETEPSLVVGGADSLFQVWKIWKEKV
jgi:WD40 repeat protein